jgi:hypothetical protein
MRLAWLVAVATITACAAIVGVDHDYRLGGGSADQGIRCADGGTYCEPQAQICCLQAPQGSSECLDAAPGQEPCQGYTSIRCDDPTDCGDAGLMCCISLNPQDYLLETRCSSTCPDAGSGLSFALCDPSASATCAAGTSCKALPVGNFGNTEWFHACQ